MSCTIHQRIKALIEDTSEIFYNTTDAMNADFAEFASLAVAEFRAVLMEPTLTRGQLSAMLRSGMGKSREQGDDWPHFLAEHVQTVANANAAE
ncbi:MAG: hypothetical protein ACT4OY_05225 [Alphaproteobacteria bacterium]